MFGKVCIVGTGIIGSSIARVLQRHELADSVVCTDRDIRVCRKVQELGLADIVTETAPQAVRDADMIFICIPVGSYPDLMDQINECLKPGAIVTDAGSVKQRAIESVAPLIPEEVHFVPGHPVAGTEQSGPEAGSPELFVNRWCILTPLPQTAIRAVEKVTAFWEACGSRIDIMDPGQHDMVMAISSHLPHLLAYAVAGNAAGFEDRIRSEAIKFSAGGFGDFIRTAASDPVIWRDIFLGNREAVLEALQRFNEDLNALKRAIRWQDGPFLHDFFTKARNVREQVSASGQTAGYVCQGHQDRAIELQEETPPSLRQHKDSGS